MRPMKPLILVAVLLAAFPIAIGEPPAVNGGAPTPCIVTLPATNCGASPAPCAMRLAPSPSGRGLLLDFDILTENEVVEANVSDPAAVSVSVVVVVRNNGTLPLSVGLAATINLGGKVTIDPAQTPMMLPQATSNIVVSATLPESTTSDGMGYLRIDGICNENPTVTYSLQIRVTIKQWHRVTIERFVLSSTTPLEKDMVTLSARVINAGNGPSRFSASAMVDGKPLGVRIDGVAATPNTTVSLAAGRFYNVAATWQATYGHHNLVLEVTDVGSVGETNLSVAMSKDTRTGSVFVGFNYRDLIPYIYVTIVVLVAAALIGYKYRKKLVPRLRRLKRILKRGEPGSEGDEGYEEEAEYEDEEYDDEYDDDEYGDEDEEYDDEDEEEAPPRRKPAAAPPRKAAAPLPKKASTFVPVKAPAPAPKKASLIPAKKQPASPMRRPAGARPPQSAGKAPARPAARPGVIMVGAPDERPAPPGKPGAIDVEMEEEE